MDSEEPLFSLIRALSQHEKRYFGLYASRHFKEKDSQPLRLFHILNGQTTYDEPAIKATLANDPLGKQYAVYKNLLYQAILRSLQNYRYEHSPGMKVRSGIDKIELLLEKGKHALALKMLFRTRAIAEDSDQKGYQLELFGWERRLLRYLHPLDYLDLLPGISQREKAVMSSFAHELQAVEIHDTLYSLAQVERRMEKTALLLQLDEIRIRLEQLERAPSPSFNTKAVIFTAAALLHQLSGDYKAMMGAHAALLAHWDRHPRMKAYEPERYTRIQVAWLNSAFAAEDCEAQLPKIQALRNIAIQGQAGRARMVFQSYNLELLWRMGQKDMTSAIKFLPLFAQKLPELRPHLDELRLTAFFMNAAILYFQNRDYQSCLSWANRMQFMDVQHRDNGFFRSMALLCLICNCELGNLSLVETQIAAIKRRIKSRDTDWEFGKTVTEWIRRMLAHLGMPEMSKLKQGLHADLLEMQAKVQPAPLLLDLVLKWASPD